MGEPTDTPDEAAWTIIEGPGPLVATAIHDGHALRPEVARQVALPDEARLREEDPFTGGWTEIAATRVVVARSRFEVDLNRPRERAVYVHPEDAWGLRVWQQPPSAELVERSLEQYDAFYAELQRLLDAKVRSEGRFVVFDLHSYNHRRLGPQARFDSQTKHPDVNIGTGTLHRARWAPVVDRVISELRGCDHLGRQLDVRENVKFMGGAMSRWVNETYPESGCSIAIELKKFFMDEWTGQLSVDLHQGVLEVLHLAATGVQEELDAMRQAEETTSQGARGAEDTDYGHFGVGLWRCPACGTETFPRELMARAAQRPFPCEQCQAELVYHEGAE